jgi:hypothetical protein
VFGDAGYQGVEKREENLEVPVVWHVALRPSKRKALPKNPWDALKSGFVQRFHRREFPNSAPQKNGPAHGRPNIHNLVRT